MGVETPSRSPRGEKDERPPRSPCLGGRLSLGLLVGALWFYGVCRKLS